MTELFFILLAAGTITAWWQLMQGRQKARRAAGHVCQTHGLQLLDDTVSLNSVTWNSAGTRPRFLVNYSFEFATNGAIRRKGIAQLAFPVYLTVTLDLQEGQLIEQFTDR